MWEKIKERVVNLFEFVTSKKTLAAVGACVVLIMVTSVPKIIAIGAVACAYIAVQGWVDVQKEKNK